jgi:hypothetical protein
MENLVKAHKRHLASDRTSCTKATANQFRLVLHTAAYWLLHTLRGLAPKRDPVRQGGVDSSAFEVAIGQAAWGGICAGSGSVAGVTSSAMASTCM